MWAKDRVFNDKVDSRYSQLGGLLELMNDLSRKSSCLNSKSKANSAIIRTYVRTYVRTCVCVCVYVCMYIFMYIQMYLCVYDVYVCINGVCMYGWMKHFAGLEMWVAVVCLSWVAPYIMPSQSVKWLAESWLAGAQLLVWTVRLSIITISTLALRSSQKVPDPCPTRPEVMNTYASPPHTHLHLIHIPAQAECMICMCFFKRRTWIYSDMYNT